MWHRPWVGQDAGVPTVVGSLRWAGCGLVGAGVCVVLGFGWKGVGVWWCGGGRRIRLGVGRWL